MPQLTSCSVCFSLLLSDTKQLLKQHDLLGADAVVCLDVLNFTSVVFTLIVNTSTFSLAAAAQTYGVKLDMGLSQQLCGLHHAVLPKQKA